MDRALKAVNLIGAASVVVASGLGLTYILAAAYKGTVPWQVLFLLGEVSLHLGTAWVVSRCAIAVATCTRRLAIADVREEAAKIRTEIAAQNDQVQAMVTAAVKSAVGDVYRAGMLAQAANTAAPPRPAHLAAVQPRRGGDG